MLIAIDVDMVLVDPTIKWRAFMEANGGFDYSKMSAASRGELKYDLSYYYDIDRELAHSFWDDPELYDDLRAARFADFVIFSILDAGHEIIFVSKCTDGHKASKLRFLQKHLTPDAVLIDSHAKGILDSHVDVFIDDRNEFINPFTSGKTTLIRLNTNFAQTEELRADAVRAESILDVLEIVTK